MEVENVTLENLANGAAIDQFNEQLELVLQNILDPNTSPTAKRVITLKVTVAPTDDRELGIVDIDATAKLAPLKGVRTRVYIGRDEYGKPVAVPKDPAQPTIPDAIADVKAGKVVNMKKVGE